MRPALPGAVALSMSHALVGCGYWPVVSFSGFLYELPAFGNKSAEGGEQG